MHFKIKSTFAVILKKIDVPEIKITLFIFIKGNINIIEK